MAQLDARHTLQHFSFAEFANFATGVFDFQTASVLAMTSDAGFGVAFLASAGYDLGSGPTTYTGVIDGIAITGPGPGFAPIVGVTDLGVAITSLSFGPGPVDLLFVWNQAFLGATTIFAPEATGSAGSTSFTGDFFTVNGDRVGANDVYVGGSYLQFNAFQDFAGDAYTLAGGTLRGGADRISTGVNGQISGDARTVSGGVLIGGADDVAIRGATFENISPGLVGVFGDVASLTGGRLVGGRDTLSLREISRNDTLTGDAGDIGAAPGLASSGGDDVITVANIESGPADLGAVLGDARDVAQSFTGGADAITLSNVDFTRFSSTAQFLSGDVRTVTGDFTGGADTIAVDDARLETVSGDARGILGNRFLGGADTITLTVARQISVVTGDLLDAIAEGSRGITGGADVITISTFRRPEFPITIFGDARNYESSDPLQQGLALEGAFTGGADRIVVTDTQPQTARVSIFGDARSIYAQDQIRLGADTITYNGSAGVDVFGDLETISIGFFTFGDDRITGDRGDDVIHGDYSLVQDPGGRGEQVIVRGGNDVIDGRAGNDQIFGNEGNDTLTGGLGNDLVDGGAGLDRAVFSTLAQAIYVDLLGIVGAGAPADWIEAIGQGFDQIRGVENVTGSVLNDVVLGTALANDLRGLGGNDKLYGRGGRDTLVGGEGNDYIDGGTDADAMLGEAGNDVFVVDSASDVVTETVTGGVDTIRSFVSIAALTANVENLTLVGSAASGVGNALGNLLVGNAGANSLNGGEGDDRLVGGAGGDTLVGGAGADRFNGQDGDDRLFGGAGADLYFFADAFGAGNVDTIFDFVAVDDAIYLSRNIFTALTPGTLAAAAFRSAAGATGAADASDRIAYNTTTGALFYDPDGVGGVAAVQFALLNSKPAITNADFIVYV